VACALSAGWRALIWPTYHFFCVPGIVSNRGKIASVFWIFMQAMASPERALMPLRARVGA
jgi:hypothetical protein